MFGRQAGRILKLHFTCTRKQHKQILSVTKELNSYFCRSYSIGSGLVELQKKPRNSEKKPWVTDINEVKRKARFEKQERREVREIVLKPPKNGLLVKDLIPVAHHVLAARDELLDCASRVAKSIPIYFCSICGDVHVGDPPHKIKTCNVSGSQNNKEHKWAIGGVEKALPAVESFHLYDRLGRAVSHNERLQVDRIPAIMELCIQAGVDVFEYPTRRRDFPIYRVAGRTIDFEKKFPKNDFSKNNIDTVGFWKLEKRTCENRKVLSSIDDDLKASAKRGMKACDKLHSGTAKLMQKYSVQTCGYCPEVQVGPKGHRVRQCQAFKHQMRDGQHAWQEATFDDVFPPVHVWHVRDPQDILVDSLKRYYGKLPAVVEMFAQAGAEVGESYCGVMREDVVIPGLDEEKLVV